MKIFSILTMTCIGIFTHGCTAHIISHVPNPKVHLSQQYRKIAIILNGAGTQSINNTSLFENKLVQTQVMDGSSQVQMAGETLAFECEKLGFCVVPATENPDLIFEFNIGSIRFDAMAGWIADQAILRLRDAKSKELVATYQAKGSIITPTVENIISNLVYEIKKNY